MELTESRLSIQEIVELSFKNTLSCAKAFKKETDGKWTSWSGKTVKNKVDNLLSIFNKDKENLLALTDSVNDKIAITLSFKNAEGSLVNFQSFSGDWWNSGVRRQVEDFFYTFYRDRESFLKLFKEKT